MSLLPLLNFAGGELDPKLHDKATLDKFRNGLATARNVMITKIGSVMSRPPTYNIKAAKNANQKIKVYCPPNTNYVLEWGHLYVRLYEYDFYGEEAPTNQYRLPYFTPRGEYAHALTEDDLDNIHFTTSGDYVYIFCEFNLTLKFHLNAGSSAFVAAADIFKVPNPLTSVTSTPLGTPNGIDIQYAATIVIDGEESIEVTSGAFKQPTSVSQLQQVRVTWVTANVDINKVTEVRIYSRPVGGGAFGLLGTTRSFSISGANTIAAFDDYGYSADYNNGIQEMLTKYGLGGVTVPNLKAKTGVVYQGRLLKVPSTNDEAIIASRPGYLNNFYRDFPYASDSALLFKAARSGKAKIKHLLDHEGLIAFTSNGVYTHGGVLSVDNLIMPKRGRWVIKDDVPPLVVPNGVFFVDTSNTIRQLIYNDQLAGYESVEQTIFSNHIFKDRTITSWCYQDGIHPMILVSFDDGTMAMFTYNFEHKMTAWTRGDSVYPIEQFVESGTNDISLIVVNKDGQRYIECTLPRYLLPQYKLEQESYDGGEIPLIDMYPHFSFMDSIKTYNGALFPMLATGETFIFTPVTPGDWTGTLHLTTTAATDFNMPGMPILTVGTILRWFNPEDLSSIDLEIMSIPNDPIQDEFIVQPASEFPSDYSTTRHVFCAKSVITGLDHLEGEQVSVMVDGYLVASPNNDVDGYPTVTVSGGQITLPGGIKGAMVHVGRPITADVKTLPATTVEQAPTTIESMTTNKLYVKVADTRGLFISNKFPEEADDEVDGTSVETMESLDETVAPIVDPLIGNRYLEPITKRCERIIPGAWDNGGSISIRQVDPLHFEILSIIDDLTILSRRDR